MQRSYVWLCRRGCMQQEDNGSNNELLRRAPKSMVRLSQLSQLLLLLLDSNDYGVLCDD